MLALVGLLYVMLNTVVFLSPRHLSFVRAIFGTLTIGSILSIGIIAVKEPEVPPDEVASSLIAVLILSVASMVGLVVAQVAGQRMRLRFAWVEKLSKAIDSPEQVRPWTQPNGPALEPAGNSPRQLDHTPPPSVLRRGDEVMTIDLRCPIDDEAVRRVARRAKTALDDPIIQSVVLEVSSPGGNYDCMMEIRRILQELNSVKPVDALIVGQAASAAIPTITCLPLRQRFCYDTSAFAYHRCSNTSGTDLQSTDWANDHMVETLVSETAISAGSLRRLFDSGQDYWFTAEQARELGVIGSVI